MSRIEIIGLSIKEGYKIVRRPYDGRRQCAACGACRTRLFNYGRMDDRARVQWHAGSFCNLGCLRRRSRREL